MQHIVFNCANEKEMLQAIGLIMDSANDVIAFPAPEGLTIDDIFAEDINEVPVAPDGTEGMSTADLWRQMVLASTEGGDVRNIREAMGFTQAEMAKRWGCTPPAISSMENNNRKLRDKSRLKLAKIVINRIAELSS